MIDLALEARINQAIKDAHVRRGREAEEALVLRESCGNPTSWVMFGGSETPDQERWQRCLQQAHAEGLDTDSCEYLDRARELYGGLPVIQREPHWSGCLCSRCVPEGQFDRIRSERQRERRHPGQATLFDLFDEVTA